MISIRNLSYRYSQNIRLFNGLSLDLLPGKMYGLLGKNGAGKSTLIKNIGGLLFPTAGRCAVFGLEPRHRQVAFLRDIFFIPEECHLPELTIKQLIQIYAPFYPLFDEEQYRGYLSDFGLSETRKLNALSYGQKKKTMIGFALSTNTKVLIMDEQTNGLDIPSKVSFRNMVNSAFKPDRIVITSSHQVRDLEELISSLIIMDQGEVLLHEEKEVLATRLRFQSTNVPPPDDESILYQERTAHGWACIASNQNGQKSPVDLELLFNAVLAKRGAFANSLVTNTLMQSV